MPAGPFGREIHALVRHLGRTRDFAPRFYTERRLSKTQWNDLRNDRIPLTHSSLTTIVELLASFVGEAIDNRLKAGDGLATAFHRIVTLGVESANQQISFLLLDDSQIFIDRTTLKSLYAGGESTLDPPLGGRVPVGPGSAATVQGGTCIAVRLNMSLEEVNRRVQRGIVGRATEAELRAFLIEQIKRGNPIEMIRERCTEIILRVSREEALRMHRAFERAEFPAEVISITIEPVRAHVRGMGRRDSEVPAARPTDAETAFESMWQTVVRRERIVRPWRRLRWLLSPAIAFSPLAHVIHETDRRCYALPAAERPWPRLGSDLVMAFVLWPGLTAASLALSLVVMRAFDPTIAVGAGVIAGLVLSLTGAQVCACVVSPLAVGAGGIAMGWMFGLAHGVVIGRFASSSLLSLDNVQRDLFTAVTGGAVGLSAPDWIGSLPIVSIALLLAALGWAIATAAWLMGQPQKAGGASRATARRDLEATLWGTSVGAGIGLIRGVTNLLEAVGLSAVAGFIAAFGVFGGLTFGLTVWIRTRDRRKAVLFALVHASISVFVCTLAAHAASDTLRPIALAAATAWFHATWFTGAFMVGGWLGSARSAVAAAVIEGSAGFLAFAVWRLVQG